MDSVTEHSACVYSGPNPMQNSTESHAIPAHKVFIIQLGKIHKMVKQSLCKV